MQTHRRALLIASLLLVSCKGAPDQATAATSSSASASASAAPSAAPDDVTPERFCAFMEGLMVDRMTRSDSKGALSLDVKKANAKKLNAGCVEAIGKVAARDPVAWKACSSCIVSKTDIEGTKACDAACRPIDEGVGKAAKPAASAPSPSASVP